MLRHIQTEYEGMFAQLGQRFDAGKLTELGRRFELTREKLTMLEEAKAA